MAEIENNDAGYSKKEKKGNPITESELLKKEIITPDDILRLDKITTGEL